MEKLRIVFMGTPDFAVTILDRLTNDDAVEIVGVVTVPDKPAGRGQKLHMSAVKTYALEHDLRVLQPEKLKDDAFIHELKALNADLFVVVAFRMLPEVVWAMPPKGTINLHASLLPQYRGAAPINWAIINGETETGVTTFFIEKEIDTGDVIERCKLPIGANESVGELYDRLRELGAEATISTVHKIKSGTAVGIEQEELAADTLLKNAPKIFKEDCKINFTRTAKEVHNFCRGLDPYPGAWCTMTDVKTGELKTYKFSGTELTDLKVGNPTAPLKNENGILLPCSDYYVLAKNIQPEGKRKMNFKEFLAGYSIEHYSM